MNEKNIINLYYKIKRIRLIEEEIAKQYPLQKMRCPTHLSIGQEAVAVGCSEVVSEKDYAVSGHRAHAHYLAKGGCLNSMIAELHGKSKGCSKGFGGSMHLIDENVGFMGSTAIVAGTIPIAVGLAYGIKIKKNNQLVLAYMGEAVTETGVFFESLNFAAVKQLPIIYVCENNLYSVYTSLKDRQPKNRDNKKLINGLGVKYFSMDGNDVINVYELMQKVVSFVRNGEKPALVEFFTYRHREHCGPFFDDNLNYRANSEVNSWLKKDPIAIMEKHLDRRKISQSEITKIETKIKKEIEIAFKGH